MPARQVEHDRVSARVVQAAILDDPLTEHRCEVLQRGDAGQPPILPPPP
jgi:hypothetical protein